MSDRLVYLEPAFVLHSRSYRESSLILDVLTKQLGKVSLLARGVKSKKSAETSALLQPFNALLVSFAGNSGLRNLKNVELESPVRQLKGMALYCGFYINELLKHLLHNDDPCPEIYSDYSQFLLFLQNNSNDLEVSLRFFELKLLENLGYGLQLTHDFTRNTEVNSEKKYQFLPDQGPMESEQGFIKGSTLLALERKILDNKQSLMEAKKLMRLVFDFHLQGKKLNSRTLIKKIYPS